MQSKREAKEDKHDGKRVAVSLASLLPDYFTPPKSESEPPPVQQPANVAPPVARTARKDFPLVLALAFRSNAFQLPQVLMLGKQMVHGPSPIRVLQFGHMEVRQNELRRAFLSLPRTYRQDIEAFLWFNRQRWDERLKRAVDIEPPFDAAERRAFTALYGALEQACALRSRTIVSSALEGEAP